MISSSEWVLIKVDIDRLHLFYDTSILPKMLKFMAITVITTETNHLMDNTQDAFAYNCCKNDSMFI